MTDYILSLVSFGVPMPEKMQGKTDHDAAWESRGWVRAFIGRNPEAYIGETFRLDEIGSDGVIDEDTLVTRCIIQVGPDGVIPDWSPLRRRRAKADMKVGDPHDEDRPPPSPLGPVRKKAAGGA